MHKIFSVRNINNRYMIRFYYVCKNNRTGQAKDKNQVKITVLAIRRNTLKVYYLATETIFSVATIHSTPVSRLLFLPGICSNIFVFNSGRAC